MYSQIMLRLRSVLIDCRLAQICAQCGDFSFELCSDASSVVERAPCSLLVYSLVQLLVVQWRGHRIFY